MRAPRSACVCILLPGVGFHNEDVVARKGGSGSTSGKGGSIMGQ